MSMGCCMSCVQYQKQTQNQKQNPCDYDSPSANIISLNGALRRYPLPVNVSQVLHDEASSSSSFFLCNSDRLYYHSQPPPLNSQEFLEANQIYFVLPNSKLQHRLTESDMASLAVKASVAIQNDSRHSRKKARISPADLLISASSDSMQDESAAAIMTIGKPQLPTPTPTPTPSPFSRSSSARRLQRHTSKRAKMAIRSFRLRLSTINEGT